MCISGFSHIIITYIQKIRFSSNPSLKRYNLDYEDNKVIRTAIKIADEIKSC